jgi:hypothetical protein
VRSKAEPLALPYFRVVFTLLSAIGNVASSQDKAGYGVLVTGPCFSATAAGPMPRT